MIKKVLQGFAIVNSNIGKMLVYTYSEIDEKGNITKSNVKETVAIVDIEEKEFVEKLEGKINTRLALTE